MSCTWPVDIGNPLDKHYEHELFCLGFYNKLEIVLGTGRLYLISQY